MNRSGKSNFSLKTKMATIMKSRRIYTLAFATVVLSLLGLLYQENMRRRLNHTFSGRGGMLSTQLAITDRYLQKQTSPTVEAIYQSTRYCNETPPGLVGRLYFNLTEKNITSFDPKLGKGGVWKPYECIPRHRVAIIIPYRDRYHHLQVLLYHLVPVLKRQRLYFQIFVVEQKGNALFNKGRIMNAAVKEAEKEGRDFQCYIFHDVDLITEDDRNMHSCHHQPKHMSSAINKFGYKLSYAKAAGGVLNLNRDIYMKVNGYTNLLWGWGSEDDDMYARLEGQKFRMWRPPPEIGRYTMFKHNRRPYAVLNWRQTMVKTAKQRFDKDGFNNVVYNLTQKVYNSSFTYMLVDIGDPPKVMPNITDVMAGQNS